MDKIDQNINKTDFLNVDNEKVFCNLKNISTQNQINLLEKMIEFHKKFEGKIKEIVFAVNNERLAKEVFQKMEEISKLFGCTAKVSVHHTKIYEFNHLEKDVEWNLKTIAKANREIEKVCDFVKKSNFSPFEALAFVHHYVSTLAKYNETGNRRWSDSDQFYAGGYLDMPEIVCAGYSTLMEEIVDRLDMKGLKCNIVCVEFKNLKKCFSASHLRCMISLKDEKYGLDQTVFDDPTWDNDENLNSKYAHFALPNNCFDKKLNVLYDYYTPIMTAFGDNKATFEFLDDMLPKTYNKSKNQIDQKMVETAFWNVLKAKYPKESFDNLLAKLKEMARNTFEEQKLREFDGYFKSKDVLLETIEAIKIFVQNDKPKNNDEMNLV